MRLALGLVLKRVVEEVAASVGIRELVMVVVGKHLHVCLVWFSGKSPLNC